MNDTSTPLPQEKKSSPWKWILIGCLGLLLVGALMTATCTACVAKKVKDVAGDISENPAMAGAEMIVRLNPELELVEKDEQAQTLTIRNKETGEMITLDVEDIQEGRFSWEADGKKVEINAQGSEDGSGIVTVRDEDGEQTSMTFGADTDEVPQWVPRYPGSEDSEPFIIASGESVQGTLSFESDDDLDTVREFYLRELEDLGFSLNQSNMSGDGFNMATLAGEADEREVSVTITSNTGESTRVAVSFATGG